MSEFPSEAYAEVQKKWIGTNYIVKPSIAKLFDNGILVKGQVVLDAGCGQGHYSQQFIDWGASEVLGVDSSSDMIQLSKAQVTDSKANFELQSLENLRVEAGKFDIACAFFVLQFIPTKELLSKAIRNIAHSLRPGGIFIGAIPNGVPGYNPIREEGYKFGAAVELDSNELHDGAKARINFYNGTDIASHSFIYVHFITTYRELFESAGFAQIEFVPPTIAERGISEFGEKFFESYLNPPKDVFFKVVKK